jgi:N-acetylglucosaminyldiphosphoundecaprenol N-acetyl-beta-D-mannosaminyltransferase
MSKKSVGSENQDITITSIPVIMRKFHLIFGIKINDLSDQELRQMIFGWLSGNEAKTIVTPNPEFFLLSKKDKEFCEFLKKSDLSLPDGVGLVYAVAALTDSFLKYRHTGVDAVDLLVSTGVKIVFVGAHPEIAKAAVVKLKNKCPSANIITVNPGIVSSDGTPPPEIINEIAAAKPQILAVVLGQGKQEKFIAKVLPNLPSVRIAIGVGGALDMIAGFHPRAPFLMRQMGLEWLWRLFLEPKRWPRIFRAVFVFPADVVWATLQKHCFWRACLRVALVLIKRK